MVLDLSNCQCSVKHELHIVIVGFIQLLDLFCTVLNSLTTSSGPELQGQDTVITAWTIRHPTCIHCQSGFYIAWYIRCLDWWLLLHQKKKKKTENKDWWSSMHSSVASIWATSTHPNLIYHLFKMNTRYVETIKPILDRTWCGKQCSLDFLYRFIFDIQACIFMVCKNEKICKCFWIW